MFIDPHSSASTWPNVIHRKLSTDSLKQRRLSRAVATDEADARRFQKRLLDAGFHSTVRQNLGRDIEGACGQLVVLEKAK